MIDFRRHSDHACIEGLAVANWIGALRCPKDWPVDDAMRVAAMTLARGLARHARAGHLSRRRARRLATALYGETRANFGARLRGAHVAVAITVYPQGGHHVPYNGGEIRGPAFYAVGADRSSGSAQ